ncbi:zinc ribbon domain-containing protein [Bacteroides xylanisolvens]|jgi:hypothetical protein|uniref:zinc ribbon domain-containing protein n=1 Tax=Bacteroides TaxID=816 RepID=UPI001C26ABA1|nr:MULTISPECIES: zinc ribbon domain-containing protein [Bacteroides]MBU9952927.1 zinc ribbon domain-containing protein [Bacteroides sp. MSK.20.12]MBV3452756.1 zinc ribbon domain-containing protein [Bacteroides xylanisolvens]MBV4223080.1 zinc ribbon domain-containing protein [Bacteroides xylanisolvens]
MKCNNCGCDNPDDAKYCRVCGNVLQLESFFERLSELGFMPTTMITLKSSLGATLLLYLLEFLFVIGCLMAIGGIVNFFVRRDSGFVFVALGGFVCSFVIAYVSFKYKLFDKSFPNRYVKSELLKEADYIQLDFVNDDDYTFIVKNKKFGVYSVRRYEIQLPAIYDWLSWKIEGQILNVQQNGRQYIMDIYGNELK